MFIKIFFFVKEFITNKYCGLETESILELLFSCLICTCFYNIFDRDLFYEVAQHQIRDTLLNKRAHGLNSLYRSATVDGYHEEILDCLDKGR